jgi:hypothetical protein
VCCQPQFYTATAPEAGTNQKNLLLTVQFLTAFAHQETEGGHMPASERRQTMEKNQASRGAHARALSTHNRRLFLARFFLLALFLALSVASLQPRTSAKSSELDCASECQQQYVQCLAAGGTNCGAQFDACLAGCRGLRPTGRQ